MHHNSCAPHDFIVEIDALVTITAGAPSDFGFDGVVVSVDPLARTCAVRVIRSRRGADSSIVAGELQTVTLDTVIPAQQFPCVGDNLVVAALGERRWNGKVISIDEMAHSGVAEVDGNPREFRWSDVRFINGQFVFAHLLERGIDHPAARAIVSYGTAEQTVGEDQVASLSTSLERSLVQLQQAQARISSGTLSHLEFLIEQLKRDGAEYELTRARSVVAQAVVSTTGAIAARSPASKFFPRQSHADARMRAALIEMSGPALAEILNENGRVLFAEVLGTGAE